MNSNCMHQQLSMNSSKELLFISALVRINCERLVRKAKQATTEQQATTKTIRLAQTTDPYDIFKHCRTCVRTRASCVVRYAHKFDDIVSFSLHNQHFYCCAVKIFSRLSPSSKTIFIQEQNLHNRLQK